jgi:hypothetical protein
MPLLNKGQIREWWSNKPSANIGIRVGPDSGLLVLDVDNKNGKSGSEEPAKLEAGYGLPPVTYMVSTPADGLYYYFRYPVDLRDKRLRKELVKADSGLDLKSTGYVVAPPSALKEGTY